MADVPTTRSTRPPPLCPVVPVAFRRPSSFEADLEAFSPGRAAAHDGHGRLAEGERAFYNIHVRMTHTTRAVQSFE